jgi:hypothetical protein
MSKQTGIKAIWVPSWYELDQSIAVGVSRKFWFYHELPELTPCPECDDVELAFFNQMDSTAHSEVRFATIAEITHPILGSLIRVDTDGLDYIFSPQEGEEIVVNAEEEPGSTYGGPQIDDWSVLVTLVDVSDPIPDVA